MLTKYGTVTPPPSPVETANTTPTLHLVCHPATPSEVSLTLTCTVSGNGPASDGLALRYELCADLSALRVPQPIPHGATEKPADGLWRHTCFEAFVRQEGAAAYREFNFSPSGQWAHYRFSAERISALDTAPEPSSGLQAPRPLPAPRLQVERHPDRLVLLATLLPDALPDPSINRRLRLALSAVVEDSTGRLSYWALHHPLDRPDFHHPAGFVHALHMRPPTCHLP